ncbi:MAG: ribbon-helix-helix domain-containing protein [Flavobacteriaceae bacterium]
MAIDFPTMTDSQPPLPGAPYGRVRKRSLTVAGHATSISLEDAFWSELRRLADVQGRPLADLVATIDDARGEANLSSALRLYVIAAIKSGM